MYFFNVFEMMAIVLYELNVKITSVSKQNITWVI